MLKKCIYIPVLKTERLVLREITVKDVDDLREWLGLDVVYKYWGRTAGKAEKNPELLFVDSRPNVKRKPSHDYIWGIEYKNKLIGIIEVFDIENNRIGVVGYRINPQYWQKGIGTEALNAVTNFIFSETKLDRLHLEVDVENVASNKIASKCGFIHEGCIRHGKMVKNFCDYNIYGMLRDDWKTFHTSNTELPLY